MQLFYIPQAFSGTAVRVHLCSTAAERHQLCAEWQTFLRVVGGGVHLQKFTHYQSTATI